MAEAETWELANSLTIQGHLALRLDRPGEAAQPIARALRISLQLGLDDALHRRAVGLARSLHHQAAGIFDGLGIDDGLA